MKLRYIDTALVHNSLPIIILHCSSESIQITNFTTIGENKGYSLWRRNVFVDNMSMLIFVEGSKVDILSEIKKI